MAEFSVPMNQQNAPTETIEITPDSDPDIWAILQPPDEEKVEAETMTDFMFILRRKPSELRAMRMKAALSYHDLEEILGSGLAQRLGKSLRSLGVRAFRADGSEVEDFTIELEFEFVGHQEAEDIAAELKSSPPRAAS